MRIVILVFIVCFFPVLGRAEIATTAYIQRTVQSTWGINLPLTGGTIASTKYLYQVIDQTNKTLNGKETNYTSLATNNVVARNKVDAELYTKIKYCNPGTYLRSYSEACVNCGIGHYCQGGSHRSSCTGGAIACNGVNHTADVLADSSLVNRVLTMSEVEENIPDTDITQWKRLSCCAHGSGDLSTINTPGTGCAHGSIGPGTYLFVSRYVTAVGAAVDKLDSLDGSENVSSVYIGIFDHAVGYKTIHANNVFNNFVDTENAEFVSYTIKIPVDPWYRNENVSNISNIPSEVGAYNICVYELR
jgi:hypothetical protein